MPLKAHERFENHMDVSKVETYGEAEKITEFSEEDPYNDSFEKKLSQVQGGYIDQPNSIQANDLLRKSARQEEISERKTNIANSNAASHMSDEKEFSEAGRDKTEEVPELSGKSEIKTSIDDKLRDLPKHELVTIYASDSDAIVQSKKKENDEEKASFYGGNYKTVETMEDLTLYRVYGGRATKEGTRENVYLTTQPPKDRLETKMDSALLSQWGNARQYYCEVLIPKGTMIHIGKVEPQKTLSGELLHGGSEQILVSREKVSFGEQHELSFAGDYHTFEEKVRK